MSLGFFDGASQEVGMKCGARVLSKLNGSIVFKLKMGCARGGNTCGELISLLCFLFFVGS